MKPNKPKQSFTQPAFNVQSGVSLIGGRLLQNSLQNPSRNPLQDKIEVGIPEAPVDGKVYARRNASWVELKTIAVDICVDGVTKKINVYVDGEPY